MAEHPAFDPYAVLGVTRTSTPAQVSRAYRHLAKRYHPDLHPGEEPAARMQRVNEAWHILSSPARRASYDLDHPAGAVPGGHWAPRRRSIAPAPPTTTRTWATWRATAEETRAAPRTRRPAGQAPSSAAPARPPRPAGPQRFRDTGWAALLAAAVILMLLAAAVVAGKLA
jgi:curved DNA-binding protein CbpA